MANDWLIYHNPKCSKSRGALEILRARGIEPRVIEYLSQPVSEERLRELVKTLGVSIREIVRTKETLFGELGLADRPESEWYQAVAAHPILLERPIVVHGNRALVARPSERVHELFEK